MTEKLLLYGGAIHLAGAVRAKASQRHTTSDWMEIERQRGISVSSSVLQFQYEGFQLNLLDTPGHKDFSEDTYRTLTAVDAAVMLIDAAKGVEPQTRKLFEVCRLHAIPIFTFINKLDRPSREPLDLLDELEKVLQIRSYPMNWPIGLGEQFQGVYDRNRKEILFFQTSGEAHVKERLLPKQVTHLTDPLLSRWIYENQTQTKDPIDPHSLAWEEAQMLHQKLQEDLILLETAGNSWDSQAVLKGELSPVFFGSAMNNFGVERFLSEFIRCAPPPQARLSSEKETISPDSPFFSGFIFKIQANMDPDHRDRVAFLRVCSGHFQRHQEVFHSGSSEKIKLSKPLQFFAQERVMIEEAWPGDIIGLLDTKGSLRIGDTLSERSHLHYSEVPKFSPEFFSHLFLKDPMKRKQLQKGLDQLSEEGIIQVYQQRGLGQRDPILGAVGALQFDVLQHRLQGEYRVEVRVEPLPYTLARWLKGATEKDLDTFDRRQDSRCVLDRDGRWVLLCQSQWTLRWSQENYKHLEFLATAH